MRLRTCMAAWLSLAVAAPALAADEVIIRPRTTGQGGEAPPQSETRDPNRARLATQLSFGRTVPSSPGVTVAYGRAPFRHTINYTRNPGGSYGVTYAPEFWAPLTGYPVMLKIFAGTNFTYYEVKPGDVDSSGFADGVTGFLPGLPFAGLEVELSNGLSANVGVTAKSTEFRGAFAFAGVGWAMR